ncbi:MAG TPA: LysR family transcriptional regulator [Phaeodactylibacter sp.]|nr:LysR family transcriptional regulator [Phaeodactylibacter sp.]
MDPNILYLDLPLLRTFITVVNQQSFSLAANELGRTQSAVSQQIKKLEEMAGQNLLNKHGRRIEMTEAGQVVYRHGMRMLHVEQQLREELYSEEITGRVRLGIPEDLATHYLLPILDRFRQQYPRIQLAVECDLTERLYRSFQANEYELVILKHEQLNVAYPDRIVKTWYDPLVWVGRKAEECAEWQQSQHIPIIVSPEPCVYRRQVVHRLASAQLAADLAYVSESYNSKLLAIRAGLGLAALPQSLVPDDCVIVKEGLPSLSPTQISLFRSEIQAKVAQYLQQRIVESFDAQLEA